MTVEQPLQAETILSTSRGADWNGLVLEERRLPAAEANLLAMDDNFICLNLGDLATSGSASESPLLYQSVAGGHPRERHQVTGEIVLLPAGRESHWQWDREAHVLHLLIQPTILERAATDLGFDSRTAGLIDRFGEQDSVLLHLGLTLRAEALSNSPNGKVFADSVVNALTIHLLRRYSPLTKSLVAQGKREEKRGLNSDQVRQITGFVRDHLTERLTLEEVARVVHVSPYHFARQFRAATGQSFHQFVIAERIEEARRLLSRRGDRAPSVAEVAVQVGFAHQSHLALHLRRLTGQSPREFRQEAWR